MYDSGRGIQPISVAITPGFVEAVQQLQELLRAELGGAAETGCEFELTAALGTTGPAAAARNSSASTLQRTPDPIAVGMTASRLLLRIHAAEDRLRGFPWGRASLGDRELAKRYDREI